MTFTRDPLSVEYDRQARAVVGLAIAQHEKRRANLRLVPYIRVRVDNPLMFSGPRETNTRYGLSRAERAFERACRYDSRIAQMTERSKPDAVWSLKMEWEPAPVLPGRPRFVRMQVFSDTEASRYAARLPSSQQVRKNPDLRSAGMQA